MSQAGGTSSSSGPIPPTVATTYVTDVNSPAVPAANILNVVGGNTIANDSDGIRTDGSSGSNTLTVQLTNRIRVTATTSDGGGQTQTVTVQTPTVSSAVTFTGTFTGYDSANNEMVGGELIGIARRSAGGVTAVVGTNDTFDEADAALVTADWDIITNATVLQATFTGVAGRTINWSCVYIYEQVT